MLTLLFWAVAGVLGLLGIAMLVAGWELVRRAPDEAPAPGPLRVHSIDLNLSEAALAKAEAASPPTDSGARRRALAHALERMSEPVPLAAAAKGATGAKAHWEDTQPRVNLPAAVRTPQA